MSDFDFPPDLLQLQRDFFAADARCEEIAASHPRSVDVVAGTAVITEEQGAELAKARAERLAIVGRLAAHRWPEGVDLIKAKAALRAAARA